MSKQDRAFEPPSLEEHFEPPNDDFTGCFGWLCGYTADTGFLDFAVERFVGETSSYRASRGQIALALMLDGGNPQITDVPGLLHIPINAGEAPFRLLHAKIALLGFKNESSGWLLRLVVSTGNWTRGTLEESLDLAWAVDVCDKDLAAPNDTVSQACADIKAAWGMLDWLRGHFDMATIGVVVPERLESESGKASRLVEGWIGEATRLGGGVQPRFLDNREASLLYQLPEMVGANAGISARNYIGMGSGFYESSGTENEIPSVLKKVIGNLQGNKLLTRSPEIDVFVNPNACQGVANSVAAFNKAGWKVREAGRPEYFKGAARSLHAKFIFSATSRENFCNNAWLYLGSGNLTGPGFANKMNPQSGNLEAGVVFATESLKWTMERGSNPEQVLTNRLPVQWKSDVGENLGALAVGSEMPDREMLYSAAPIACVFGAVKDGICWLTALGEVRGPFDVLDGDEQPCYRDSNSRFRWSGGRPQKVRLRWTEDGQTRESFVPVLDESGRIAATTLSKIDVDQAWEQLASFPMPPDDEDLRAQGDDGSTGDPIGQDRPGTSADARYPVRRMMQLVENIAAKQTAVSQGDWSAWCVRLEQCLIQAAGAQVLEEFAKFDLNPLSPLWQPPFRPDYAEGGGTKEGRDYEGALTRVEKAWKVSSDKIRVRS